MAVSHSTNGYSSTQTESPVNTIVSPKLWAGKYKSAEDMEAAIVNKDAEYSKLSNEYKSLKETHDTHTKVPEKYSDIEGIGLRREELADIQEIAKNAGLTQRQYEQTAKEMEARVINQRNQYEKSKQSIGDERLNILQDYVKKNYPESLQSVVLDKIIRDEKAMSDALKHRDQTLNSSVPGIDQGGSGAKPSNYDGQKEVMEAAKEYHRNKADRGARERYERLAIEVGNERFKDANQ